MDPLDEDFKIEQSNIKELKIMPEIWTNFD